MLFAWENTVVLAMMKKERFLNLILLRNYGEAVDIIFLYTMHLFLSLQGKDVSEIQFSGNCRTIQKSRRICNFNSFVRIIQLGLKCILLQPCILKVEQ